MFSTGRYKDGNMDGCVPVYRFIWWSDGNISDGRY